jgi:hypothetical protein
MVEGSHNVYSELSPIIVWWIFPLMLSCHSLLWASLLGCRNSPLSTVLLSVVSVTHVQAKSENSKFHILRKWAHVHIIFIRAHCYTCSILLLDMVYLLLCLIYKLDLVKSNFSGFSYVCKWKNIWGSVWSTVSGFFWGSWNIYPEN